MILKNSDDLDKGINPLFQNDQYGYLKTKDNKFVSIGNLESKFKNNFNTVLNKLDDSKTENNADRIHNYFLKHNRDELFVRV